MDSLNLNRRAATLCQSLLPRAAELRLNVHSTGSATVIDLGAKAPGGLEAGLAMAEVCLAGLGRVSLVSAAPQLWQGPAVAVHTDQPLLACLASQYAGWQIAQGKYFAMGSGPMRAAAGKESLFEELLTREQTDVAVGVLETSKLPPEEVVHYIAEACGIAPSGLTLLAARTASQAGAVQVVARSVETALHKLHELGFDLKRIASGWGMAPLPPVAADDLAAIGRTNDAVLYGGEVVLWVHGDDASLEELGPRVPSNASPDYGEPFGQIFARYDHDFYKIDPHLFSPAAVTFMNLDTGRTFRFGRTAPEILQRSFAS